MIHSIVLPSHYDHIIKMTLSLHWSQWPWLHLQLTLDTPTPAMLLYSFTNNIANVTVTVQYNLDFTWKLRCHSIFNENGYSVFTDIKGSLSFSLGCTSYPRSHLSCSLTNNSGAGQSVKECSIHLALAAKSLQTTRKDWSVLYLAMNHPLVRDL